MAALRTISSDGAKHGTICPIQVARQSAKALKKANEHETHHRSTVKEEIRAKLNDGATYVQWNNLKLPGSNAFRVSEIGGCEVQPVE